MRRTAALFLLLALVPMGAFAQTFALNLSAVGQGTIDPAPPGGDYGVGVVVDITATPAGGGHALLQWVVDGVSVPADPQNDPIPNPLSVTMDSDHTVIAVFSEIIGTLNVTGNGTTNPPPGVYALPVDPEVTVEAIPDPGWQLDHWEVNGVNSGYVNPIIVTLTEDTTITAVFAEEGYRLSLESYGQGSITPAVPGGVYPNGTVVDITATPAGGGHALLQWVVDGVSVPADPQNDPIPNPLSVTMDSDHTVIAVFSEVIGTLNVTGNGTTNPPPGVYALPADPEVTVEAIPDPGWQFDHWEVDGVDVGSANPYSPTVAADFTLRAVFVEGFLLSISATGQGTTTPAPPSRAYAAGATAEITAVPNAGHNLTAWVIDGIVDDTPANPLSITMDADRAVEAVFTDWIVTFSTQGNGSGGVPNGDYPVVDGTAFPLQAVADSGWLLSRWEVDGVDIGNDNPTTYTVTSNVAITAVFEPAVDLTIAAQGSGTTDPLPGVQAYAQGAVVAVTAIPDAGHILRHWLIDGVISGSANPLSVTMDVSKSVTAVFSDYLLEISAAGSGTTNPAPGTIPVYDGQVVDITAIPDPDFTLAQWVVNGLASGRADTLQVTASSNLTVEAQFAEARSLILSTGGNGTIEPAPGIYTYPVNGTVEITATPDANHQFLTWVVDGVTVPSDPEVDPIPNPLSVTMDQNHVVQAIFTDVLVTVDVSGSGTIDPAPSGAFPAVVPLLAGTSFDVTAVPDSGWEFGFWSIDGVDSGNDNPKSFTFTQDTTLVVVFEEIQYWALTVSATGNGTIDPAPGTQQVEDGTSVEITATPNVGHVLTRWLVNGVEQPATPSIEVLMDEAKTVQAVFSSHLVTLAVEGQGTTTPGAGQVVPVANGDQLQASATPATGWSFSHWMVNDNNAGTSNPLTLSVTTTMTVTAVFTVNSYNLTTAVSPVGSGFVNPGSGTFDYGTVVSMQATPDSGYLFDHWEGDLTGSTSPADLTIDGDKSVTAVFVPAVSLTTNVTPSGAGTVAPAFGSFPINTVVALTATPSTGFVFVRWEGGATGSSNPVNVTMDTAKTVTAVFLPLFNLVTEVTPQDSGAVTADPPQPVGGYVSGTLVTLTAAPEVGFLFDRWEGAASGTANPTTVTMDASKTVTAVFVRAFNLTTAVSPQGGGTVGANPAPGPYAEGASVTLTATPAAGYEFDRWEGALTGSTNPATLVMDSNKSVTAVFRLVTFDLSTAVFPLGAGTVSPGSGTYTRDTVVTLTATPAANYVFDRWELDATGTTNPTTVTMDANKSVRAVFRLITYNLTTNATPAGSGAVDPAGGAFGAGSVLSLSAVAANLYRFDHWEGDATGTNNPTTITMDGDKDVTAVFVRLSYTLSATVQPVGAGTVTPDSGTYDPGTAVSVQATPAAGFRFDHWEGSLSGTENPQDLTMDANKSIVAVFVPITYTLTTAVQPAGAGSIQPAGGTFNSGTVVTLEATPNAGFAFERWEGAVTGTDNPTSVTMDGNKSVTAVFSPTCQLQNLAVVNPQDGDVILVGVGSGGVGIVLSAATNCPDDTASVTFTLDSYPPVVVTEVDGSGYYSAESPTIDELGFGSHTLLVVATGKTGGTTLQSVVTFTLQSTAPGEDGDNNGVLDQPFVTLRNNGEYWYQLLYDPTTGLPLVSGAARWEGGLDKQNPVPPVIILQNPNDRGSVVNVTVPDGLLEAGEVAIVMVVASPDIALIYGAATAQLLPEPSEVLVDGGMYVEVSIIVSTDGGATYAEIDPSRLVANPVQMTMEGLYFVPGGLPLLYSHATTVQNNPSTGTEIVPAVGAWGTIPVTITARTMSASLLSLSAFAPYEGPAIKVAPFVADPALFDVVFGFVERGSSKDTTVTVTNLGGQVLSGSAATGAPFSVVGTSAYSLNPGESAEIVVRYTPSALGSQEGLLTLSGGSGVALSIVGTGFDASATGPVCAGGTTSTSAALTAARGDLLLLAAAIAVLLLTGRALAKSKTR